MMIGSGSYAFCGPYSAPASGATSATGEAETGVPVSAAVVTRRERERPCPGAFGSGSASRTDSRSCSFSDFGRASRDVSAVAFFFRGFFGRSAGASTGAAAAGSGVVGALVDAAICASAVLAPSGITCVPVAGEADDGAEPLPFDCDALAEPLLEF